MTAPSLRETTSRVSQYFGDAGPFSYTKVRKITPALLEGRISFAVATAGLKEIKFDLARTCNMDVAKVVAQCTEFRGRTFYPLDRVLYPVDREFAISLVPETVAVVNGIPNLIFLQPRKHPTLWAYNAPFMKRVLKDAYIPNYYDECRFWLLDTEYQDKEEDRALRLIDLESVAEMDEREFLRRAASLRAAWRLYLRHEPERPKRSPRPDTDQGDFGFDDL